MLLKVKKIPWLAIILLFLTYFAFGINFEQSLAKWREWWLMGRMVELPLTLPLVLMILRIVGGLMVLLIVFVFTGPFRLIEYCFGNWLQSDTKTLFSVLGLALLAVLVAFWLQEFIRLLVLTSAVILLRFELQTQGYKTWLRQLLLISLSLLGFYSGTVYAIYIS